MPNDEREPVLRFAPSPNGPLHLGHAYSALLNHDLARSLGGRLLVRMEDIDRQRCTPEYERAILEDLDWLGVRHDGQVLRQSERFDRYANALERLDALGVVYPAFLTRGDVRRMVEGQDDSGKPWPRDPDGAPLYPTGERDLPNGERQRLLSEGRPHALRLDVDRAAAITGPLAWHEMNGDGNDARSRPLDPPPEAWGDVVLARWDMPTSYHLSVVVDDAAQGVTHVVRGNDLRAATSIHRTLQTLLGLPEPIYHHHALIRDDDGAKLSKSRGSDALATLRRDGHSSADVKDRIRKALAVSERLST